MTAELVVVAAVPILKTGTYELSTGTRTFAEEDLIAAKLALDTDPAIVPPRIKIDSLAKAMDLDPETHGGEPAFGWFDNFEVTDSGQTLVADAHVPEWLAASMEWAYPSRSIEGTPPGWESATGRKHELVITAVALLGIHWPGVTTLEDFEELLATGPELPAAPAEEGMVLARMRPVRAGLDQDLVVRRFYDAIDTGDLELPEGVSSYNLWVRSMRFDDGGQAYLKVTDDESGNLYRVDFTVTGGEVAYGQFVEVIEQDVPVTASSPRPSAPLVTWASRDESRALATTQEADPMSPEQRRALALALGLPEDTDEATLHSTAAERAEAQPAPEETPEPETPAEEPETPETPETPAEEPEAVAAGGPRTVTVSQEVWDESQRRLATVEATVTASTERERREHRDGLIAAALRDGRIAPSEREAWRTELDTAPEATARLLATLAAGRIPVSERGDLGEIEAGGLSGDDHEAYMRQHFPSARRGEHGAARGAVIRSGV